MEVYWDPYQVQTPSPVKQAKSPLSKTLDRVFIPAAVVDQRIFEDTIQHEVLMEYFLKLMLDESCNSIWCKQQSTRILLRGDFTCCTGDGVCNWYGSQLAAAAFGDLRSVQDVGWHGLQGDAEL